MSRTIRISISVRGSLNELTSSRRKWSYYTDDKGRQLTRKEAIDGLMDELAKGRECIPCDSKLCGNPCPTAGCKGFDYSDGGCPGFETPSKQEGGAT